MTKNEALRMGMDALVSVLANHKGAPVVPWNDALDGMKAALEAKDEPVACSMCNEWEKVCDQHLRYINKLKKKRTWVGLTDEEIYKMASSATDANGFSEIAFARAIEAAHGIKGGA